MKNDTTLSSEARQAYRIANAFVLYIEGLRIQLFEAAGGPDPERPEYPKKLRDKDVTTKMFVTDGAGDTLRLRIQQTRSELLALAPDELRDSLAVRLPLFVEPVPPGTTSANWVEYKFKRMPVAAVFPILGKYKYDALASADLVAKALQQK